MKLLKNWKIFLNNNWKAFAALKTLNLANNVLSVCSGVIVVGGIGTIAYQYIQKKRLITVAEGALDDAKFWKEAYESESKKFEEYLLKDIEFIKKRKEIVDKEIQKTQDQIEEIEYYSIPSL